MIAYAQKYLWKLEGFAIAAKSVSFQTLLETSPQSVPIKLRICSAQESGLKTKKERKAHQRRDQKGKLQMEKGVL